MKNFETSTSGQIFFGKMPSEEDLFSLTKLNVHTIWNLAQELKFLIPEEKTFVSNILFGDIKDYDIPKNIPNFIFQLKQIKQILSSGNHVFIHCLGGRGRTGIALASLKIICDKYSAIDALLFSKQMCNGPETKAQENFVCNLEKFL